MNYYERHLGDYAKDTSHLSQAEHGAYNLLMDYYYATEIGLEQKNIYRIGKSKKKSERDAVDFVISEFFYLENGLYKKKRIEEEIAKAQVKIRAAQENGKKGGRKKTTTEQTQHKPTGLNGKEPTGLNPLYPTKTQPLSPPDSKHQTPIKNKAAAKHSRATPPVDNSVDKPIAAAAPTADATQNRTAELTAMLRKRGAVLPDDDPNVRKWAQAGISDTQVLAALETAQQRRAEAYSSQPINSGYLDSIITGTDSKPGKPKKANATPWWTSNELMTAKARELKITPPMPGESWEQFRGRINAKLAEAVEKAET